MNHRSQDAYTIGWRQEGICNYSSVHMGLRDGMQKGTGAHTIGLKLGTRAGLPITAASNQRSISMHKLEID